MTSLGPLYGVTNRAQSPSVLRSSGDYGSVRGPIDDTEATGSARLGLSGDFNYLTYTEFAIRNTAVTGLTHKPLLTSTVSDPGNVGNGTIAITVGAGNQVSEAFTIECMDGGDTTTAAAWKGPDYTDIEAVSGDPSGVYLRHQTPGASGNGTTIQITASPIATLQWTGNWTDSTIDVVAGGQTAATGYAIAQYQFVPCSADPTTHVAVGDIVTMSSGVPTTALASGAYKVVSLRSDASNPGFYVMRSLRGDLTAGHSIYVLAATSGYQLIVNDTIAGTVETFDRTAASNPIRSTEDIRRVVTDGGEKWGGAAFGPQASTVSEWVDGTNSGDFPPEEMVAADSMIGGVTTAGAEGYGHFVCRGGSVQEDIDADGAPHSLFSSSTSNISVTLTQGTIRFAAGDKFTFSTKQARFELSTDGGATYAGTYDASDSGTTLARGRVMDWTLGEDTTPWVVGDVYYWRDDYQDASRNLGDGDRNLVWRVPANQRHAAVFGAQAGKTYGVLWCGVKDHNATDAETLELHGDSVEPYGTSTLIAGNVVTDANWESGAGPLNEYAAGFLIVTSGAARGEEYTIASNTTAGAFTLQGGDDPAADGMLAGDQFILVNPSPEITIQFVGAGMDSVAGVLQVAQVDKRFWTLYLYDSATADSTNYVGALWFGVPIQPTAGPVYRPDQTQRIYSPRIKDTPNGRRRVLKDGVLRQRIVHDYSDGGNMGVTLADHDTLYDGIVEGVWNTSADVVRPIALVEYPNSTPERWHIVDLMPDPIFTPLRYGQYAVAMTFETRERATVAT